MSKNQKRNGTQSNSKDDRLGGGKKKNGPKKAKEPQGNKCIRWVFRMSATLDYGDYESEATKLYGTLIEISECFAFQIESAPNTGYMHYQGTIHDDRRSDESLRHAQPSSSPVKGVTYWLGYLELINKNRHTWIQNQLAKDQFHFHFLKKAEGTPVQAWEYATKLETRVHGPWTCGQARPSENANKSYLFVQAVKKGSTDAELCDSFPGMVCNSFANIQRIRQAYGVPQAEPERTTPLEVFLFWGPSGCGKSEFARQQARLGGYLPYVLPIGKDFWLTPAMCGKKYVIIEDFKSNLGLKDLLNLLDKYPVEVPIKGGFAWWMPDIVVITTNRSPHDWYNYNDRDDEKTAVFRRITGAYKFDRNPEKIPKPIEVDIYNPSNFIIRAPVVQRVCNHCGYSGCGCQ